jgi:hypothetical protein
MPLVDPSWLRKHASDVEMDLDLLQNAVKFTFETPMVGPTSVGRELVPTAFSRGETSLPIRLANPVVPSEEDVACMMLVEWMRGIAYRQLSLAMD